MTIVIQPANLDSQAFTNLVERHLKFCDGTAPAESCHRLPLSELAQDDISVWEVVYNGEIVGMGALKALSKHDGEVKSMHTLSEHRGLGIGTLILKTIITTAQGRKYSRLWLETGVHLDFSFARKLYEQNGFVQTGPFGNYRKDPHSLFMTLDLKAVRET